MTRLEAASRPIRWIVRESREANRTDFARIRKADADSTISQPRYGRNQPPLNHEPTILRVESKNDSDSTIPHPRSLNRQHRAARPWLVHQLPRPSCHFLHHPRREGSGVRSAYLQGDGGLGMAPRVRRVGARSAACRGLPRRATVERRVYNFPAQGDCAGGKNMIQ